MPRPKKKRVPPGFRYRHPLGWYEVAVPPGWVQDTTAEPARFVGPGGEAVAVVSVAKLAGVTLPRARSRLLRRKPPGLTVLKRGGHSEGVRDGLSWARSEELLARKSGWWKRLFRRPKPQALMINVCYTRGPLLVLITVQARPDRVERHQLMIDAMINSLQLTDEPTPAPPEFVDRFVQLAEGRFPDRAFARSDEPLSAVVDGAQLALDKAYNAFRAEPELGDAAFDPIFRYLTDTPIPALGTERFDDVQSRVYPAIKPLRWVQAADRRLTARDQVLRIPFPNDTAVVFVIDYGAATRFVSHDEAERWETPPKLLIRIAQENLGKRSEEPAEHVITTEDGIPHALALVEGDGYDAARLLLPNLRPRLEEHLGPDFAVAIPNRDLLLAFRTDKRQLLRRMRGLLQKDTGARPYPITDGLFRLTDAGTIEPFET
ncbi:DUF1444 family protein [Planctomycetota bacterium]